MENHSWLIACGMGLLGLLVGSFLNVVIHRLPRMLHAQWAKECAQHAHTEAPAANTFNLWTPRSGCPHCGHAIGWLENIPVLSYLWLRGRCLACHGSISGRYLVMELLTSGLFFYCGWRWGAGPSAWVWAGFAATLLALAAIDWESGLLPDALTLPLLWAGLISAALSWTGVVLPAALWGAVAGYLFLWAIFWAFKLCTGKEGMGYGDFKLLAALGAWLGWQSLIALILLASVLGSIVGLTMRYRGRLGPGDYLPFGPFLAAAGFATWVLGPATLNRWIGP